MIDSRTTMPLPNVTTRSPSSNCIGHKAGDEARFQGAYIAERVPDLVWRCTGQNFFSNGCHSFACEFAAKIAVESEERVPTAQWPASGDGWTVSDLVCTAGRRNRSLR